MVSDKIVKVNLADIDRPKESVRININADEIRELADSIREQGLLQPVLLRPVGSRYEIVAGDRRYMAHSLLGEKTIKAIVRDMSDTECYSVRATENLQRANLSPLEEAKIYSEMRSRFGMNNKQISRALGVSDTRIILRLRLLEMPENVQQAVHEKRISLVAVDHLWRIDNVDVRNMYLQSAIDNGVTEKVALSWLNEYYKVTGNGQLTARQVREIEFSDLKRRHYGSCDICEQPVESEKLRALVICPDCMRLIVSGGESDDKVG